MKKISLISIIFVTVILTGCGQTPSQNQQASAVPSVTENQMEDETARVKGMQDFGVKAKNPEEAVTLFMDKFMETAINPDNQVLNEAVYQFSQSCKTLVPSDDKNYLQKVLGVDAVPENSYTIDQIFLNKNEDTGEEEVLSSILVTLHYENEDVTRLFKLAMVDNTWKINGIGESE